ncbi:TetR/AcrR family transcriptional regulator [Deinococcus deserti]|uniref:HTH tetR-type domain-containing protein n=1 Tax=Deinococcus deserti (strain DSM 17065 / CIP 109153 / LMG 22923 / VCD115) TaxID=546414 RepID=C1CUJ6_DEIDV|nr:TetR/AcrR family transcriptional regulator [Deinococcus deserti]ACO45863.1 hypothetical protein Deide_09820 [Deinococcus deserti VCD115]
MRRKRGDWLAAGFDLLREEGEQALTLERLCGHMALTRGSFYHHFKGMPEYRQALLDAWKDSLTEQVIAQVPVSVSGLEALSVLDQAVTALDHRLDLAFRAWSLRDPAVREAMSEVDARRISALTLWHEQAGHPRAGNLAQLEYATFLGAQALGRVSDEGHLHSIHALAMSALIRELIRTEKPDAG